MSECNPAELEQRLAQLVENVSHPAVCHSSSILSNEIRGQLIRKGESVVMWYPSANRDEDVFSDPYKFDIERDPNDHFAFGGFGEHFCLGAHLARWELRSMFHALLPVLPKLELASEPEFVEGSLHVGGIKRMMVRSRAA